MSKLKQLMFIGWNWNDPDNRDPTHDWRIPHDQPFDQWPVQDAEGCILMRIDPSHQPGQPYAEVPSDTHLDASIQCIKALFEDLKNNDHLHEQAQIQVYLHGTQGFTRKVHQTDLKTWAEAQRIQLECFVFRSSDSCLYLTKDNPNGLLSRNGRWGRQTINNRLYQAFSNDHVHSDHFHFVWNFHEHKLDQELFELHESLVKILPLHWIPDAQMSDFEWNLADLRKQIDFFAEKRNTAQYIYQNWPEVLQCFNELMDSQLLPMRKTLNNGLPSAADLGNARAQFTDLLNALPGSHIYVK
jgi:hypothetical protein